MDLALRSVAYIMLALISIGLLLLFVGRLQEAGKQQYCDGYKQALQLSPDEQIPSECVKYLNDASQGTRNLMGTGDSVGQEIAANAAACWKLTGARGIADSRGCGILYVEKLDGNVSEAKVRQVLQSNGQEFKLNWKADIKEKSLVKIDYDADAKAVVIS
ncbi:Uncharacterised protein [Candidatus Gugararchaeum adminiculabundum]|nr:Uncharacterised protein [Candidatus Gugararchaeum adminiculabundum]